MAISSSGAVWFANIHTEFGGSNPISLNEFYSGSLPSNTASTTVITPTVSNTSTNYTSGKSTFTRYSNGWAHSSIRTDVSNTTGSITVNERSGVDLTGNSGAVPSSGTIDMNKFRGTSAGTAESIIIYGVVYYVDTGSSNYIYIYTDGHRGTAGVSNASFGTPFVSLSCAAKGDFPATTIHCTDSNTSNGFFSTRNQISHTSNGTLGNYTVMICTPVNNAWNNAGNGFSGSPGTTWSGTWSITVNH